jgi:arsenate reductase (glutaredoxin)
VRDCADPRRPHGWIDESFVKAYTRLFEMGWAHSFETWRSGHLVGGLYGVAIDRFFAGESMFHVETDASKAALVGATRWLAAHGFTLFDVQWTSPHLCSLGAVDVPRSRYLRLLADAVRLPPMERVTIFHNPRCSKSRGALEILDTRGVPHDVVEYLRTPPDRATLERIVDALDGQPAALLRGDDATKAGLDPAKYTERGAVIDLLLEHPELMQRPVVIRGDRAVIGRPPENIEVLL